jgi:DNA repair ATPase RecN
MQEQEGQDYQPESPTPILDDRPEVSSADVAVKDESPAPRNRFRRILLWVLSLIIIFAAGVILTWTMRVQPQAQQLVSLEAEIVSIQDQVDTQIQELEKLRPLVDENEQLKSDLSLASAHLDLLNVLVDVTTAQLALAQEDDIAARAALTGTDDRLGALEGTLDGANAVEVHEMSDRLQLVIEEVESDSFAARRDLEILANNLLALERVLFGE